MILKESERLIDDSKKIFDLSRDNLLKNYREYIFRSQEKLLRIGLDQETATKIQEDYLKEKKCKI